MMGRTTAPLTALAIKKLSKTGLHFVGHVSGLAINVTQSGSKSWILRLSVGNRRRDMGLGSYPEINLLLAKDKALESRRLLSQGLDPINVRQEAKEKLKAEQKQRITFKDAAAQYIALHRPTWKNAKHAAQWVTTLEVYAYPVIGNLTGDKIKREHIVEILEPIWMVIPETASRLRGRLEKVLDWMKGKNYRSGDNPAAWNGNLEALFPARNKVAKVEHFSAMPWEECPTFFASLIDVPGASARALQLCILTATRSGEVRGARLKEFDLERDIWTIPTSRMKAGKEQRIPLTKEVKQLILSLGITEPEELLFTNSRGKPLSDMALTMVLRRMDINYTAHGFRSTFRDWAGETTRHAREVIEHALAHRLKDKAEAAYARGDLFKKRIALMQHWTKYMYSKSVHRSY